MPSDLEGTLFIDMATSAVAGGKISVARARGTEIPEGWILDKDGNQTTDPEDLGRGGVQLPLGGPEGHKGYGLSVMVKSSLASSPVSVLDMIHWASTTMAVSWQPSM